MLRENKLERALPHEIEKQPVLTLPRCEDADFSSAMGTSSFQNLALRGDMMKEGCTFLSRMAPGAIAPWHWHTHTEELVVLKGTIVAHLEGQDPVRVEAGGYSQLPGKHIHRFRCTDEGECLVFVVDEGPFDLHWVDTKGNEISEEEANRRALEEGTEGW
ncbi:cupin domain-containing protein [Novosphingobium mangrovi (ex Huang et al. 2023)]|uniref:Cupin domain-containing protein n=1 Tax=Novosphingobium mangrovi (ex Huang et al. 2023) TaxID=2976432 RepID=A0ABT2I8T8_9SPHN|nr:cupin domain-containing protein [Novosphingobium mangrovi (ex Huang et al. 2023)]MCT2401194.1 cupin domain-containing protein [Novosphingobium mangrovi (ex Huang et al. 2023)]